MQGWLFSATEPGTEPRQFWGIRRCNIAEAWDDEASMAEDMADPFDDNGSADSYDTAGDGPVRPEAIPGMEWESDVFMIDHEYNEIT